MYPYVHLSDPRATQFNTEISGTFILNSETNSGCDVMRVELACYVFSQKTILLNLAREHGKDVLKIVLASLALFSAACEIQNRC